MVSESVTSCFNSNSINDVRFKCQTCLTEGPICPICSNTEHWNCMYNSIQWWWERNWWHIEIDSKGRLRTKPCDKRDDFNFPIVNFPEAPAYRVCISQLIRYFRAGGSYHIFLDRGVLLPRKLLNQWFLLVKLKSSLWMFYGWPLWYIDLCHKWPRIYVPLVVNISRSFHYGFHSFPVVDWFCLFI